MSTTPLPHAFLTSGLVGGLSHVRVLQSDTCHAYVAYDNLFREITVVFRGTAGGQDLRTSKRAKNFSAGGGFTDIYCSLSIAQELTPYQRCIFTPSHSGAHSWTH
jgi:hypothetical protein